jgi:hypothetical protein
VAALASAAAACGGGGAGDDHPRPAPSPRRAATPSPTPAAASERRPRPLRRARCPVGLTGCRSVIGRVLYVERVDPDGDGDLHVVVLGGAVTAPGVTAIDVEKDLRPRRDPRVGDRATAAGRPERGSFGQLQIAAVRFRFARG